MSESQRTIVLASGGTGGHIFPAEALAVELKNRGDNVILLTDKRYKNYAGELNKLESHVISTSTIGGGIFNKMKGAVDVMAGFMQAYGLLNKIKPDVVVGFGGYPSFPTMMAALKQGRKTIIHEQNSMLGKANYVLARKVDVIATSFKEVSGIEDRDMDRVILTGNPVRQTIKTLRDMQYPELREDGILRILVTGGSQGASIFSTVVPEAIKMLPSDFRKRIRVDQQCRPNDLAIAKEIYDEIGVSADLATFFNDMPSRLASAHIVIARSGASTLAELTVAGRPVIMVPFPHAKDDHQSVNANALEDVGGGWVIPEGAFTPASLSSRLENFLNLPETLKEAAENAKKAGMPDADRNLADLVDKVYNASSVR